MSAELKIREALDDLAAGPAPADLADRALRGAARRRVTRIGTGAVAAVTALGLGIAAFVVLGAPGPSATQPGNRPATAPCVFFEESNAPVLREEWPGVVSTVVAALPKRYDYTMNSGYAWCAVSHPNEVWEGQYGSFPVARAKLQLDGEMGGAVLGIDVHLATPGTVADCAAAASIRFFTGGSSSVAPERCVEPVGDAPLVFGGSGESYVWRTAVYPDGTTIALAAEGDFPCRARR